MSTDAAERARAQASEAQRRAADPRASVWVEASAGSGKTKVLTDRMLTLMLEGTPPARLLCLTFTKAAAGEMANRLADRLAVWTTLPDSALTEELRRLLGGRFHDLDPDGLRGRARSLFAAVLDAPGGMKIQTIHAFCQSLLGRFPLEAGIAPGFRLLEEGAAREMLAEARETVLAAAALRPGPLAEAVETVAALAGEQSFGELIEQLIGQHVRLRDLLDRHGSIERLEAVIQRTFQIPADADESELALAACRDEAFDRTGLAIVARALAAGSENERAEKLPVLQRWLDFAPEDRRAMLDDYRSLFLTNQGEPRKNLLTKAARAAEPAAAEIMEREAERLRDLHWRCCAIVVARASAALLRIGAAILDSYETAKAAHALLDYDDLILKTRDLLTGEGRAAWVLYKLDGGLDHLLVDEAQDTNPDQWAVIKALTAEFFAGEGARDTLRTVFAVGDAKQSIYSFQRADPRQFIAAGRHFEAAVDAARLTWRRVPLDVSFRSTAAVLRAVDEVFARVEAQAGVRGPEDGPIRHQVARIGQAGLVELWPPADPPEAPEADPWRGAPEASVAAAPADVRLARLIAARIARWTAADSAEPEAWLPSRGRRLRPGDVLVLVRRRNRFVEELVRALKQQAVPVAGVDRMALVEQLAVMDLIALGRVMLLPEDDLTLATVLKGPLIDLDEMRLFELAHGRPGSLWEALRARAAADPAFAEAHGRLAAWMAQADFVRPFEFYSGILGPDRGRARLLARLGSEAADAVDEFLNLALAYERERAPSLEGFLHWLEIGRQEVKRDLEQGVDAVRVMTVHGAKGLQAPVVILPDTLQGPPARKGLFWQAEEGGLAFWPPNARFDVMLTAEARNAARVLAAEEYRRLLYVAMTRAEDRLYVAGWNGRKTAPADCWYKLVRDALEAVAEPVAFDFGDSIPDGWSGPGWRLATRQDSGPEERPAGPAVEVAPTPLPDWAGRPPPPEAVPPRPLAPSRPEAEETAESPLAAGRGAHAARRFTRGRLVHRLLQSLPSLPPDRRRAAGTRFLGAAVHGLSPAAQDALLEETLRVLEDPALAPLFGPHGRAEVPLAGLIEGRAGPEAISGQVDRLLVADQEIVIVDYKTNRPPPASEAEVPAIYLRQMAAYRAVLQRIYPGRPVRCLLLWTDGPRVMQLSDARLDGAAP